MVLMVVAMIECDEDVGRPAGSSRTGRSAHRAPASSRTASSSASRRPSVCGAGGGAFITPLGVRDSVCRRGTSRPRGFCNGRCLDREGVAVQSRGGVQDMSVCALSVCRRCAASGGGVGVGVVGGCPYCEGSNT